MYDQWKVLTKSAYIVVIIFMKIQQTFGLTGAKGAKANRNFGTRKTRIRNQRFHSFHIATMFVKKFIVYIKNRKFLHNHNIGGTNGKLS